MSDLRQLIAASHGLATDMETRAESLRRVTVQVDSRGRGSGVLWRQDGLVVTNAHVVRGQRARVTLLGGETVEARVRAVDPRLDLALLDAGPLDALPARLGAAAALRPGDIVFAMGHPLGIADALALGVVHAVERTRAGGVPRWLCADVRLAPGNSGGPLADAAGRVVGINSMVVGGLGVAVPTEMVVRFVQAVEGATRAA
jgi:serine protease Do